MSLFFFLILGPVIVAGLVHSFAKEEREKLIEQAMYLTRIFPTDAEPAVIRIDVTGTDGKQHVYFCIYDEKHVPKEYEDEEGTMYRYWWYLLGDSKYTDKRSIKKLTNNVITIVSYMPFSCLHPPRWYVTSFSGPFRCNSIDGFRMRDISNDGMMRF